MDKPRTRNFGFTIILLDCAIDLVGAVTVSVPVPVPVPVPVSAVCLCLCLCLSFTSSDLAVEIREFRHSGNTQIEFATS